MTTRPHYPNAPITEAIIDLRVRLPDTVRLSDLENVYEAVRDQYPDKTIRNLAHGRFEVGKHVAASASRQPIGFLFKSEDEKQIFQTRFDGFTMSRLAPYESWEPFRDEARRLWEFYREVSNPEALTRLAVRYVNRIDIPLPFDDLKQYLRTFPEVSPDLPQALSGLFMQLTIPQPDIECMTLVSEALVEPANPDVASIILDIDLFRPDETPQDDAAIWQLFEVLHERKNAVFEACITDKARELFQ